MPQSTLAAAPPGGAAERIEHSLQVLEHALSAYAPATLGTAFMLMGANSRTVSQAVGDKLDVVNDSLPEGVIAKTVYDLSLIHISEPTRPY